MHRPAPTRSTWAHCTRFRGYFARAFALLPPPHVPENEAATAARAINPPDVQTYAPAPGYGQRLVADVGVEGRPADAELTGQGGFTLAFGRPLGQLSGFFIG